MAALAMLGMVKECSFKMWSVIDVVEEMSWSLGR